MSSRGKADTYHRNSSNLTLLVAFETALPIPYVREYANAKMLLISWHLPNERKMNSMLH